MNSSVKFATDVIDRLTNTCVAFLQGKFSAGIQYRLSKITTAKAVVLLSGKH